MKKYSAPINSDRFKKSPTRPGIPGLFSSQNSLFSSILENKKDQTCKHKTSQTQFQFQTYRSETPNQQPFINKYLLRSSPIKSKKNNLVAKETIQTKFNSLLTQNKSADQETLRENQNQVPSIINSLKTISQQIKSAKISSLNQQILQNWQKTLFTNCEKLAKHYKSELNTPTKIIRSDNNNTTQDSSIVFEKLLAEERRNRLLVEEQTSKIIESQEAEIKSYIDKIKQLEQRLLEKANWKK